MKDNINLLKVSPSHLLKVGLVAVALLLAFPAFSAAASATYAYVDQNGDVRTVVADSPAMAMATAPSIDEHSGVMLLVNPADGVVGDHVLGV